MNAAGWAHARVMNNATLYFNKHFPEYRWLVDFDFKRLTEAGYVMVRPDLAAFLGETPMFVVEISMSTLRSDLNEKKEFYRLAGIEHYVVLDCEHKKAISFFLDEGVFVEAPSDCLAGIERVFDEDYKL